MIESVMVIPLMAGVIAAIFYFGWTMGNQQRLRMAERHVAWHNVHGDGWYRHVDDTRVEVPLNSYVNGEILMGRSTGLTVRIRRGMQWGFFDAKGKRVPTDPGRFDARQQEPTDKAMTDLAERVRNETELAGPLADDLLHHDSPNCLPLGSMARFVVYFPSNVGVWKDDTTAHRSHYIREGLEWRALEAECLESIRDVFLKGLDDSLESVVSPGEALADDFQRLYLRAWRPANDDEHHLHRYDGYHDYHHH
jgi:hypothetical protein